MRANRPERGFTLIELVTVVAIVAILAAIAIPTFTEQVRKSRRAEAVSKLGDLVLRQEKYRVNNASYGTCDQILAPGTCASYNDAANSPYYTFGVTPNGGGGYALTATPRVGSAQASDSCGVYTFTMTNGTLGKNAAGGQSKCL